MAKVLTLDTADGSSYLPDKSLIGTTWKHTGNGHTYVITAFVWNGETDRWMIQYIRLEWPPTNSPTIHFVRTPQNFFGTRSSRGKTGVLRFVKGK